MMSCSRLTLLLFLYVLADFANPLMPGAVNYPNRSVEAAHVERSRMADVLPVVPVLASFDRIALRVVLRQPLPLAPVRPIAGLRLIPVPRALLIPSDPPPLSEDH